MKANGNYKENNSDTLMGGYWQFIEERKIPFPTKGKNALPTHLQANRESEMIIQSYGKEHLADKYCKMMTGYIHNALIPELVKKEATTKVGFLKRYNLTKNCDAVVLKWMHVLEFRYNIYKKNYYVNGHESSVTVCYRWKFIGRYIAMERRMHRWIQIDTPKKIEPPITFPIYL